MVMFTEMFVKAEQIEMRDINFPAMKPKYERVNAVLEFNSTEPAKWSCKNAVIRMFHKINNIYFTRIKHFV
jgi:hypothetical protein